MDKTKSLTSEIPRHLSLKAGWTTLKLRARFQACALHFFVCLLLALCITLPLVFWLYPAPFFRAAGGLHLIGFILTIDIVIGPVLTFLVFDRAKKSLKKDLALIGFLQISALLYGLYATALSRPVFMTYVVDRYEMVSAADVDPEEFLKAPSDLKMPPWGHPEIAYAQRPDDADARSLIMFSAVNGVDINRMFRYYKPAKLAVPEILKRAKPIADLKQFNQSESVNNYLSVYSTRNISYVPVQGKKQDLVALVDSKTGDLIEVVDLRPWPDTKSQ